MTRTRPRGGRMQDLAKLANLLARPEMQRRSVWHTLAGFDHWAVLLIRHTRRGDPPEPRHAPTLPSPAWLRRTGHDLTSEQLIHERISQYMEAELDGRDDMTIGRAASAATDAVKATLHELGVALPDHHSAPRTSEDSP